MSNKALLEMVTAIVSAHAGQNQMTAEELQKNITGVYQTLEGLSGGEPVAAKAEGQEIKPAMSVNKAFGADKVYCLVCGQAFTTLKKHIAVAHQMTPKEYRKTFGIPAKTPLVARKYSEAKKRIAQEKGLAQKLAEGRAKRKKGEE